VVLEHGRIVEDGSPSMLLRRKGGVYNRMYSRQLTPKDQQALG
jgi:ABC-type multidrug transport system fused ATPase/permease subunit